MLQRYTFLLLFSFFFIEKMSFSVIFFVYLNFLSYFRGAKVRIFYK